MVLDDKLYTFQELIELDDDLNEVETQVFDPATGQLTDGGAWNFLGKCKIMPNTAANVVKLNDGTTYIYSYEIVLRKPKDIALIPMEDKLVRFVKKDATIDTQARVKGFVTLKQWLKIWV